MSSGNSALPELALLGLQAIAVSEKLPPTRCLHHHQPGGHPAPNPQPTRCLAPAAFLLLQALDLPHGIPSRDVIRRVLSAVKVGAFQSCFVCWLNSLRDAAREKAGISAEEKTHMAIDGKTMKRSHNRAKGLGPMHMVSAWLSEFGLTMAQVATEEKSNEITAIPELMRLIDLKGAIITIDAMGTQVAIAEQIVEGKGDFILALKANQDSLFQQVMNYVDEHISDDFARIPSQRLEEDTKKGHGRMDSRTYIQLANARSPRIWHGSDASLCPC